MALWISRSSNRDQKNSTKSFQHRFSLSSTIRNNVTIAKLGFTVGRMILSYSLVDEVFYTVKDSNQKQALFVPMLNKVKSKANEAVPLSQLEYARGADKRNEARSEIKRPASTKDGNEEVLQWIILPYMAEKIRLISLVCQLLMFFILV